MKLNNVLIAAVISFAALAVPAADRPTPFGVETHGGSPRPGDTELLLRFSHPVLEESLKDNLDFGDANGSCLEQCTVELHPVAFNKDKGTGVTLWIRFKDGYEVRESWKYKLSVKKGLRYLYKETPAGRKTWRNAKAMTIELKTGSRNPLEVVAASPSRMGAAATARTKTAVISDTHIGDRRSRDGGYAWLDANIPALTSFLGDVLSCGQIKELVVAGDMFDEWLVPMADSPFTGGVTSNDAFFEAAAADPEVKAVVDKLNDIANSGLVSVVYVPGNHDMLLSEAALKAICPNAVWKGGTGSGGVGVYWPEAGVAAEHGHIYDFFNAPDPLTRAGSILPPGYFVTRMYATANTPASLRRPGGRGYDYFGNLAFDAGWYICVATIFHNPFTNSPAMLTGIDGYTDPMLPEQARANYADADIAGNWTKRQTINGVYKYETELGALLAGSGVFCFGDLEVSALRQYLEPGRARIVVFGHTHDAMLKQYTDTGLNNIKPGPIYANSGTWIDGKWTNGRPTRTFVVINTAAASGSSLDTVSLYQYNQNGSGGYEAVLLNEAQIDHDTPQKTPR